MSCQQLGIDADVALAQLRLGGGWSRLTRADQQRVRVLLLDLLQSYNPMAIVTRLRAQRIQALATAFANKAKRGTPLARQVLTKALQPVLVAYFGGDWLSLLDYLDAPVNPAEEIVTALPEPRLYVGGAARAVTVAAEHGLDIDQVHAMLAAYTGQTQPVSPVEQRVEAMRQWWHQFDAAHARQRRGMPALWGLVDEGIHLPGNTSSVYPTERLYRTILSANLVAEVDRLWDGLILPRWPERTVSEPHPHNLMAEAFGPALTVWHGVALTAWYLCEGPYSRTTLPELGNYHRREVAALAEAGTPIDARLFDELMAAEAQLGEPQEMYSDVRELVTGEQPGSITIEYGGWQRREGFELLRDIITRHRREWAAQHLDHYLHARWHAELAGTAHGFHRFVAAKGKPPTLKQFAKLAAPAANHWFGGDLAGLYAALGEKAPTVPHRIDLLPVDAQEFTDAVYAALGGVPYHNDLASADSETYGRLWALSRLAAASVFYVQAVEALGRPPEPKEFDPRQRFDWPWPGGVEEGWPIYQEIIFKLQCTPTAAFPMTRLRLPKG